MLFYAIIKPIIRFALMVLTGVIWLVPENCHSERLHRRIGGLKSIGPNSNNQPFHKISRIGCTVFANPVDDQGMVSTLANKKTSDFVEDIRISGGGDNHHIVDRSTWSHKITVFLRALYLIFLFAPLVITAWIAYFSVLFRTAIWFPLLKYSIANSGAAFVKWGQWASTRSDIFPPELCVHLATLQEQAPAHSFYYTRNQIEMELKDTMENIFEEFDPQPIASGSIAQIHKAFWKGKPVAVKVRHPGVEDQIHLDFELMIAVARWVERLPGLEWLSLSESMIQFSHTIASQTNLTTEGVQLLRFGKNFRNWHDVVIPEPFVMTESVLIETFLEGQSISSVLKKSYQDKNYLDLAYFIVTRGEDIYLNMLLKDNFMHADLHPGNILYHEIETTTPLLEMQMVDAGMTAELTALQQLNFIGLIEAIGEGNGAAAADHVITFSPSNKLDDHRRDEFRADMINLFKSVARGYGNGVDLGIVLRGVLELVRRHKVTIEANYATLVLNALCLDGMAQSILPTYNILDGAKLLLKLHKHTKRLPVTVGRFVRKLAWPVVQKLKTWSDRKFLKELKSKTPEELKEIFEMSKKFVI